MAIVIVLPPTNEPASDTLLDYSPLIPGPKIAVENTSRAEIIIEEPLILK